MTIIFEGIRAAFAKQSGKPIVEVPDSLNREPSPTPPTDLMSKFRETVGRLGDDAMAIATGGDSVREGAEEVRMARAVDYDFLRKVEGFETKGYVPVQNGKPIEQSGVTIASGFDLGQHSASQIRALLPKALADKLVPYAGLKREAALNKIKEKPVSITKAEAEQINLLVKGNKIEQVASQFNKATKGPKFDDLPKQWQTVIASVAFQYGSLSAKTPNFWKQITSGDWEGAVKNLNNFGDKYPTRRKQEAALVANVRP